MYKLFYVDSPILKDQVIARYPEVKEFISGEITEDTVIAITSEEILRVNNSGILHINIEDFDEIYVRFKKFISSIKEGMSVKEAANLFIQQLTGE